KKVILWTFFPSFFYQLILIKNSRKINGPNMSFANLQSTYGSERDPLAQIIMFFLWGAFYPHGFFVCIII
ncbi:MAG: hypothetical protein ACTSP5_14940, partial [Candidatus Heimdallarchaeota archaeon]